MKKLFALSLTALAVSTAIAMAGSPDSPGGFGKDRANNVKDGGWDSTAPGASEWGSLASERAGTNGDQNRDWSENVTNSTPNPANDQGSGND